MRHLVRVRQNLQETSLWRLNVLLRPLDEQRSMTLPRRLRCRQHPTSIRRVQLSCRADSLVDAEVVQAVPVEEEPSCGRSLRIPGSGSCASRHIHEYEYLAHAMSAQVHFQSANAAAR